MPYQTRPVVPHEEAKSLSQEQTFTPDLQDRQVVEQILLDQAEQVALAVPAATDQPDPFRFRIGEFGGKSG